MEANETIAKILQEGETIKWQQKPSRFPLIEEYNKKSLLLRWILTVVISIGIIVAYLIIVTTPDSDIRFNMILPAIIIVVAVYMILRPVIDHKMLSGRTFIFTDKRAAMITRDGTVKEMSLDKINEVVLIDRQNGNGDILLGKDAVKFPYRKIRTLALVPREDIYAPEGERISGMAFFNVPEVSEIKNLFLPGTRIETKRI